VASPVPTPHHDPARPRPGSKDAQPGCSAGRTHAPHDCSPVSRLMAAGCAAATTDSSPRWRNGAPVSQSELESRHLTSRTRQSHRRHSGRVLRTVDGRRATSVHQTDVASGPHRTLLRLGARDLLRAAVADWDGGHQPANWPEQEIGTWRCAHHGAATAKALWRKPTIHLRNAGSAPSPTTSPR
jgi:hypothetical protein